MRFISALLVCLLSILFVDLAVAEERPFSHFGIAKDAERYEA